MICNKKDWELLDAITVILVKRNFMLTFAEQVTVNNFIMHCRNETKKEKERNAKTAQIIAERRKTNPNYCRPKNEWRKHKN